MKCSDSASKAIIPGKLMAWRVYDENGQGQCDIISMDDEVVEEGKPIIVYDFSPDAFHKRREIVPLKVEKLLFRLSKTVNLFANFLALAKRKPTSKTN